MASFDEFLKTGRIGPLATGMMKETVRALLGDPEDTSISKHPEIWKYGPIELAYYRASDGSEPFLTSILYRFEPPSATPPQTLKWSGWTPGPETYFEDFRAHLEEVGIPIFGGVASGPRQHLVLGSSARVTFEDGKITTVGFTARREPEFKQLSLSVRKENLDQIHREAKSRGLSASAPCSLWISEQVTSLKSQTV